MIIQKNTIIYDYTITITIYTPAKDLAYRLRLYQGVKKFICLTGIESKRIVWHFNLFLFYDQSFNTFSAYLYAIAVIGNDVDADD
jgi:hypothetical protein